MVLILQISFRFLIEQKVHSLNRQIIRHLDDYFLGNGQDKGVEVNFQDGDTEYKIVTGLSPVVAERDCVAFEVKILLCKDINSYAMKCIASDNLLGKHFITSYCEVKWLLLHLNAKNLAIF